MKRFLVSATLEGNEHFLILVAGSKHTASKYAAEYLTLFYSKMENIASVEFVETVTTSKFRAINAELSRMLKLYSLNTLAEVHLRWLLNNVVVAIRKSAHSSMPVLFYSKPLLGF